MDINIKEILSFLEDENFGFEYYGDENLSINGYCPVHAPKSKSITCIDGQKQIGVLFIDASQFFTDDMGAELKVVEPPLGCMSILSYLAIHVKSGNGLKHPYSQHYTGFSLGKLRYTIVSISNTEKSPITCPSFGSVS